MSEFNIKLVNKKELDDLCKSPIASLAQAAREEKARRTAQAVQEAVARAYEDWKAACPIEIQACILCRNAEGKLVEYATAYATSETLEQRIQNAAKSFNRKPRKSKGKTTAILTVPEEHRGKGSGPVEVKPLPTMVGYGNTYPTAKAYAVRLGVMLEHEQGKSAPREIQTYIRDEAPIRIAKDNGDGNRLITVYDLTPDQYETTLTAVRDQLIARAQGDQEILDQIAIA